MFEPDILIALSTILLLGLFLFVTARHPKGELSFGSAIFIFGLILTAIGYLVWSIFGHLALILFLTSLPITVIFCVIRDERKAKAKLRARDLAAQEEAGSRKVRHEERMRTNPKYRKMVEERDARTRARANYLQGIVIGQTMPKIQLIRVDLRLSAVESEERHVYVFEDRVVLNHFLKSIGFPIRDSDLKDISRLRHTHFGQHVEDVGCNTNRLPILDSYGFIHEWSNEPKLSILGSGSVLICCTFDLYPGRDPSMGLRIHTPSGRRLTPHKVGGNDFPFVVFPLEWKKEIKTVFGQQPNPRRDPEKDFPSDRVLSADFFADNQ